MPQHSDKQAETDGNWGRFEGRVVAEWLDDGRDMRLVEPFVYVDVAGTHWPAPAESVVNGASIPQAFWSVIGGPFVGRFRNASVVHDVACVERTRNWREVHRMFYEACRCADAPLLKSKIMYYAVYHFGPRWQPAGRGFRDETPPQPTAEQAAAVAAYFEMHDVSAAAIPDLTILAN
ncbi:MAG: DUF1353 domain-containing protein [Planctomycetia bacterium]|nr:DUF1353 domain-containing protein [Planctomycetia bacterium]